MKTLSSVVKVMAVLGALVGGQVLATPVDIDMSGFGHDIDGTPYSLGLKSMTYDSYIGVSEFGLDSDLYSASYIELFDGVVEPGDYGKDSNEMFGLFFGLDGNSDWYLGLDFTNADLLNGTGFIQLSAVSSWYDTVDTAPLFDIDLFNLDITSADFSVDGDDILYSGGVSALSSAYDPFGFSGKKVSFNLFQARVTDGGAPTNEGNASLSFNVTEVPEPSSIVLFSFALLMLSRLRFNKR